MSYKANDYTPAILANETWKKVFSPTNINRLLDFLIERQWIPSQVSINRALTELKFRRTDGGSAEKDARALISSTRQNLSNVIAEIAAPPLTRAELDHFASLSSTSLQRAYWGPGRDGITDFAIRYNRAAKEHGFRIPPRPQVEEVIDDSEIQLSAAEYHATPAQTICRLLQTNPAYKRAVDRLIAKREI
jgi:hypothetical protein